MSTNPGKRTAAEIYALSQGNQCEGGERCHYCDTQCRRTLTHDEVIELYTGRPRGGPLRKNPSVPYICVGCWLWRRKRVSAPYMEGGVEDGICPKKRAWFVWPSMAWAIRKESAAKLYARLLNPPPIFFLTLLEGDNPPDNFIQCCSANHHTAEHPIRSDTPLKFTINNVVHTYTVYELEQAAVGGTQGREPGVQALIRVLGNVPKELVRHVVQEQKEDEETKRERGRPPKEDQPADLRVQEAKRTIREIVPKRGG